MTEREKLADASALQNIRTASEIERDRLARKAARRAELADDIKWTDWDGAVNTDQPIFDALAAATQIDTEPDGFPRIVISASKFIETFNNHRDRALCTSLRPPPIPDGRIAREALEELVTHFIVKNGPNKDKRYGHLELWWAGKSVNEEPSAAYNPFMLLGSAGSSYSLAAMGHLQGVLKAIKAALALPDQRVSRWQDIATAPKSIVTTHDNAEYGEHILAYPINGGVARVRWWQSKNDDTGRYHNFVTDGGAACKPTHWQPLPLPPERGSKEGE